MAYPDTETTSTTHANFLPEIWASDTQDAVEFEEILSKLVNTSYEKELRVGLRNLTIPHYINFTANTLTEGASITFEANTLVDQTITIDTYKYASFLLNAVVQVQSSQNDRKKFTHKCGYALVRGIETTISALVASFSQYAGTLGADVDDSILRRSWQYLADGGFYSDASWWFSPGCQASIFGNDKFTSRDYMSEKSALETAKLPVILGYPAYCSNLLTVPSTGQHDNALIHRSAIILLRQIKPTVKTQYLIERNADAVLVYTLYKASEAEQPIETASTLTVGDYGAVWIKGA